MAFLERNANVVSTEPYAIDNSLKLESDNSEYLKSGNISATPTDTKIGTYSCWIKRTELGASYIFVAGNSARYSRIFFNSDDKIQLYAGDSGWNSVQPITNAVYRDTAAWYHLVWRIDSNNGTAANRLRLYVNGVEQTWGTAPNITQNANMTLLEAFGSPGYQAWGANLAYYSASAYFNGYLAEVHYVDGQSLAPTSFGETDDNGVWIPKKYSGAHGNCGYYLDFADSGNLGDNEASSGSTFDFNENNIAAIDQATDTPTNNFCTMNNNSRTNGNIRTQEGGTRVSTDGGSGWCSMNATMGMSSGKWYWEVKFHNDPGDTNTVMIGVAAHNDPWIPHASGGYYLGNVATGGSTGWYFVNGGIYNGAGTWTGPGYGDIAMVAYDADNTKVYFGVNGTWQNSSNPVNGTNGQELSAYYWGGISNPFPALPAVSVYQGNYIQSMNFGGVCTWDSAISSGNADANGYGNFEYAPPTGFYSLCTKNLAEFG
jgi:hypothetical protein